MSQLLSDYPFPIKKNQYKQYSNQLINMKKKKIDINLVFYYFQLPDNILLSIIESYKKMKKKK